MAEITLTGVVSRETRERTITLTLSGAPDLKINQHGRIAPDILVLTYSQDDDEPWTLTRAEIGGQRVRVSDGRTWSERNAMRFHANPPKSGFGLDELPKWAVIHTEAFDPNTFTL